MCSVNLARLSCQLSSNPLPSPLVRPFLQHLRLCPQVARCTKIINADSDEPRYIINVKQFAKFVVDLSDQVAPTDIEEGMRVG